MESNPRIKSKHSAEQGKGEYPSTNPVFNPFHYDLSPEATDSRSCKWERRRQELYYMALYPTPEQGCVQAYRAPPHTDSGKRGFTESKRFMLCKCFCNWFSIVHMYFSTFISCLWFDCFQRFSQFIDTRLIAQGCRTTQYWWKGSSAQGHTMNLYDYDNNPGIFNIHEEQTWPPISSAYLKALLQSKLHRTVV